MLFGIATQAQEAKRIGNIAEQPLWGPTGYNTAAFYFIPDVDGYYDVIEKKFIYLDQGKWVFSETLPETYKNVDLFSSYKVVINRPQPYLNYKAHKARYANYLGQKNKQVAIINSTNEKYFVVTGHPKGGTELSQNKE